MIHIPEREVRLVLPYPPGVNDYWRMFVPKKGPPRMLESTIGRTYKEEVRKLALQQLGHLPQFSGPLRIEIQAFRPRRSGDVDRHSKVVLDGLQREVKEGVSCRR